MILSLRKLRSRLTFTLLFLALTLIVFTGYRILLHWIDWSNPYDVPQGQSLKVFQDMNAAPETLSFIERLRWFYNYGE